MQHVKNKISIIELQKMSKNMFEGIVKAVVDVEKGIMIIDAPMHADQESILLEQGSKQANLWGINIHPFDENMIEFDSMINLRPSWGNRSRGVDDPQIQEQIKRIVSRLVER